VGIRFLHSFEIVHRDLKPENIMVVIDEDSQEISNIKIIDFGFSNYLSKLTEKSTECISLGIIELLAGTPNYIAP
jgi:serine/threonine protein kinase